MNHPDFDRQMRFNSGFWDGFDFSSRGNRWGGMMSPDWFNGSRRSAQQHPDSMFGQGWWMGWNWAQDNDGDPGHSDDAWNSRQSNRQWMRSRA